MKCLLKSIKGFVVAVTTKILENSFNSNAGCLWGVNILDELLNFYITFTSMFNIEISKIISRTTTLRPTNVFEGLWFLSRLLKHLKSILKSLYTSLIIVKDKCNIFTRECTTPTFFEGVRTRNTNSSDWMVVSNNRYSSTTIPLSFTQPNLLF